MRILFIVIFQILFLAARSENDSAFIELRFRLCCNQKNIEVPVFDKEDQTFSYASSNDTLICEVLPIAKQVPRHPSATITTVAYNMLTKKNKTITQTLPVPLNAIENIHYVIIKHYVITKGQDYKYVFKNKEDNLELFEMFGVEKNTVQVEP